MNHFTKLFNLPLLITLLTVLSCGRPVTDDCEKKTFNILCNMLYNEESPDVVNDLTGINNRTKQLEAQSEGNSTRIEAIVLRLSLLEAGTTLLTVQLADVIAELIEVNTLIENLNSDHSSFLLQFNEYNNRLTNLTNLVNTLRDGQIAELIDLCNNHKEILIKLGDGSLIALYGGNKAKHHRLQVITPGDYITTDGEDCDFTVHNDLSVSW